MERMGEVSSNTFGYIKRNLKKWTKKDKQRLYREAKNIVMILEKELNY